MPIGNVILTSTGVALQRITDDEEIPKYHEMVLGYLKNNSIKFAEKHDFILKKYGGELEIIRNN